MISGLCGDVFGLSISSAVAGVEQGEAFLQCVCDAVDLQIDGYSAGGY